VRVRRPWPTIHRKQPAEAEAHPAAVHRLRPHRVEPHALLVELYGAQHRDAEARWRSTPLCPGAQNAALAKELVIASSRAAVPGG